ncbi:MAG: hypothetical protein IT462_17070 [Planctomycetes bacterium]|nr:hypothetical protein [Planctomycetota bacterium]
MSGQATTTTTVSTARAPIALRREERKKFQFLGSGIMTHVVILGLACLIWWISFGNVAVSRTLPDAAALIVTLDPEFEKQDKKYSLMPMPVQRISLNARGPAKELTQFESDVVGGRANLSYSLTITPADVERLTQDNLNRVMIEVPLSRFKAQLKTPAEIALEPANPSQTVFIPLEEILRRDAIVNLQGAVVGEVPGFRTTVRVQEGTELEVVAPASRLRELQRDEGRVVLEIERLGDINQLVDNKARVEKKEREQLLKDGIVETAYLVPLEGSIRVRRKGTDADTQQVTLKFSFEALSDYRNVNVELPVNVINAPWMTDKGVRVANPLKPQNVQMRVLNTQVADFNAENVQLRLDLSKIKLEDVKMEPDPAPGKKRGKVFNLFLSLEINREKLTFRFTNPAVTAKQYLPVDEVQLEWTEP